MEDKIDTEIRRVLLKFIVLKTIKDHPTHGYEIIHHIKEITGGRWTPSAGSIYPILERLETNGHIKSEEIERKSIHNHPEGSDCAGSDDSEEDGIHEGDGYSHQQSDR